MVGGCWLEEIWEGAFQFAAPPPTFPDSEHKLTELGEAERVTGALGADISFPFPF